MNDTPVAASRITIDIFIFRTALLLFKLITRQSARQSFLVEKVDDHRKSKHHTYQQCQLAFALNYHVFEFLGRMMQDS